MDMSFLLVAAAALVIGALIGWLFAARQSGALKAERDGLSERFRSAVSDLAAEAEARKAADIQLSALLAGQREKDAAHDAQIKQLQDAQAALTAQFREVGQTMLGEAQKAFLERAEARFRESETTAGQNLKALLTPVHDRLEKYEAAVAKVEAERREAYGSLSNLIETMRVGQEEVKRVTANLNNRLRNAPKARGRWGEQQLRNVLESCGLSEPVDFETEVSRETEDGRLRPDAIINVPGGRRLVVDAKVSLNAYQDAFGAAEEGERVHFLAQHASAMKAHVTTLGAKAYQDQFDDAPDYVIMFVPGEHFLAAALEQDPGLWDYAFGRRVLLATPTNLVAIARTIAGVWRQEKVADQAREIAALGKELYSRMTTMGSHIARVGKNLDQAASAYNSFVGSFESQVLTQAKRFEALDIETGGKEIPVLPVVEQAARPLSKLGAATPAAVNDAGD